MTTPISSHFFGLESEFLNEAFCDLDLSVNCDFDEYLSPNEGNPEQVSQHLADTSKGIIVSTGTERSLFDLLLAPDSCKGLVVRDTNPRVKAYVDFIVLNLRICSTRDEFIKLTSSFDVTNKAALNERVKEITQKIELGELPEKVKQYYEKNLENFAKVYIKHQKWRDDRFLDEYFSAVKYHRNEAQFRKLQKYAREGNIISTIGEINDLNFLRNRNISIVDTSNIEDYTWINLNVEGRPKVISTIVHGSQTFYVSSMYISLIRIKKFFINLSLFLGFSGR